MAKKTSNPIITTSKNYRLLHFDDIDNRNIRETEHKHLRDSIKKYGMLSCFPIICVRNKKKELVIKDGQHRFKFAEKLGLPFHYLVSNFDFDVALVNSSPKTWTIRDYAEKWERTINDYKTVLDFGKKNAMSVGISAALLNGLSAFGKLSPSFKDGTYTVSHAEWATHVASVYREMLLINKDLKSSGFLQSIIAVCQIKGFDSIRLITNANRCRDLLVPYSKREMYLDMLEKVYNHRYAKKQKQPIKFQANEAAKDTKAVEV